MLSTHFHDSETCMHCHAVSLAEAGLQLRRALKTRFSCITLDCSPCLPGCTAHDVLREALRHTGVPDEGDYLDVCIRRCSCYTFPLSDRTVRFGFHPDYRTTLRQEAALSCLCRPLRADLLTLPSPSEQLHTIHKLLTRYCRYRSDPAGLSYTAYGALILQEAVCQGISAGFYRLALECGIDSRIVYGFLKGRSHAWNLVRIGPWYYQLDITNERDVLRLHTAFPKYHREPDYRSAAFDRRYPPGPESALPILMG